MNIEELKEGIKKIGEPRRTGYGGVWQKSSGISGEIS